MTITRSSRSLLPVAIGLILAGEATAQTPAAPCAPDVVSQISALRRYADGMGFTLWPGAPEGSLGDHYQGVQRLNGPLGIPYLIYARSGGEFENHAGDFGIVKMATRDRTPERLRPNRLWPFINIESTPPNYPYSGNGGDRLNANYFLDGMTPISGGTLPWYAHASAPALIDDILVLPLEKPQLPGDSPGRVLFLDLADPNDPVLLYTLLLTHDAGTASIVKLPPPGDGRFLLAITGQDGGETIDFWKSTKDDLRDPDLAFAPFYHWHKDELLGGGDWPTGLGGTVSHQNFDMIRQCGDDRLFLAGARNDNNSPVLGNDKIDVYELYVSESPSSLVQVEQVIANQVMVCSYSATGNTCNFLASSGFYVAPDGEIILYAMEYHNDGPADLYGKKSVRMGEFRHFAMRHDLTCEPGKGWAELYDDHDFGDRSIVVDFRDRGWEAEADLDHFESFGDKASSAIWCIPEDCELRLYKDKNYEGGSCSLVGAGRLLSISDFADTANDANGGDCRTSSKNLDLSSVQWNGFGCYAAAPEPVTGGPYEVEVGGSLGVEGWFDQTMTPTPHVASWDMDGDGEFETPGLTGVFDASAFTRPSLEHSTLRVCDDLERCGTAVADIFVVPEPAASTLGAAALLALAGHASWRSRPLNRGARSGSPRIGTIRA